MPGTVASGSRFLLTVSGAGPRCRCCAPMQVLARSRSCSIRSTRGCLRESARRLAHDRIFCYFGGSATISILKAMAAGSPRRGGAQAGHRIVFLAESPAGAMLEILVHLPFRNGRLPEAYSLARSYSAGRMRFEGATPSGARDWRSRPASTQKLGDGWIGSGETPLARVPSAVLPQTWNVPAEP